MVVLTISMEDYLEKIYKLTEEKGCARAADVASSLNVLPSSVSKMLQKMDDKGLVSYERYRGFRLTPKGSSIASDIANKHQMLEGLYRILEIPPENTQGEIEGVEHQIGKEAVFCIRSLVQFLEDNPNVRNAYIKYREELVN
ncbi:MAG TPA: transcriptional regulator MntR [Planococcus sp. (in: firmicutes)]|nr:transcriptional regulator MntR [Planococcus sp. (in: firmicutes)]